MCRTPFPDPESEDPPRWMLGAAAQDYPVDEPVKFDMIPPAEYARRIEAGEPPSEVQADIMSRVLASASESIRLANERAASPEYRAMIHRNPDGPDPLIEEPGP